MIAHGLIMVLGGVAFGLAIIRARVFPAWTAACSIRGEKDAAKFKDVLEYLKQDLQLVR